MAWAALSPHPASAVGPLLGLPFGAKDIFRDARFAHRLRIASVCRAPRHSASAALIEELAGAGAVLLGKTHTTAFASFDPAPTR